VFLYAGLSTCCKYSFNHESNIEVSPFFCLSSSCDGGVEANVSHGLLLMLLTVCRWFEFGCRHQFRVTSLLWETLVAHCESKLELW